MQSSGQISLGDVRRVFQPARHPGTVDYYGNYYPGGLRFPQTLQIDINTYRDADNDEIEHDSRMPEHPEDPDLITLADFYSRTCPVYGAYVEASVYVMPAYSYYDAEGDYTSEPAETFVQPPYDPPDDITYANYHEIQVPIYGWVTHYTTSPTATKVDYNYGYNYYIYFDEDLEDWVSLYGPYTNAGSAHLREYGDLDLWFNESYAPEAPFPGGYFEGYFELNVIYSYMSYDIIDYDDVWVLEGYHTVTAYLDHHIYDVKRLN
jgi:hypothetical protein